jgi:hypothetical protein
MKLVRATMVGVLASGLVLVVACSSSDSTPSGSSGTSGNTSGGTSGDAGNDTGATGDTGVAKKATGATCMVDSDCESDHCKTQGAGAGTGGGDGGVGTPGTFCTIFCAEPRVTPAPECSGPLFTGKCSGMSFCEIK